MKLIMDFVKDFEQKQGQAFQNLSVFLFIVTFSFTVISALHSARKYIHC